MKTQAPSLRRLLHGVWLLPAAAILLTAILAAADACAASVPQAQQAGAQQPFASVLSFGADPSGSRDSTSAFVQAIESANVVYVPAGTYSVRQYDTVVLRRPGQMLIGAGRDLSILDYAGPCQAMVRGTHSVLTTAGPDETVRALAVTSHLPKKCMLTGISVASAHNVVDNVAVSQMWHVGVALHGSWDALLDSDIEYNYYGVAASGPHQLIRGNYISNHWSTCGEARPWSSQSMYWDGIAADGLVDSVIDGNTSVDNGQSGIYTGGTPTPSSGNVISHNTVQHNGNEGIDEGVGGLVNHESNYVGELFIVDNVSEDNFRRDIWLADIDGAVVADNQAVNTPTYSQWWGNSPRTPSDTPIPCEVWQLESHSMSNKIVFAHNVCNQSIRNYPALVFNTGPGTGSILGFNQVTGTRLVQPSVDRSTNAILP